MLEIFNHSCMGIGIGIGSLYELLFWGGNNICISHGIYNVLLLLEI
jgi:hypothetical protein